jgi:Early transcription elongation factor of RNA pol II, NGN section
MEDDLDDFVDRGNDKTHHITSFDAETEKSQ